MDKTGSNCALPGTQPCCSKCGCSLGLKLRALDSTCPHQDGPKWGSEQSTQNSTIHGSNISGERSSIQ